jgi:hypothetical protein
MPPFVRGDPASEEAWQLVQHDELQAFLAECACWWALKQ